ncbi:MAG TPA: CopG family transcriptional regulator [Thermoplasmata archaeon]|nr:CopG family transcriptional regulator [Thermoplasmata archaeon]
MADAPTGTRTIQLPEETVRAIEARIRGTGFASPDAFVEFLLARLLEEPSDGGLSEDDEKRLRDRLRSLGYID